MARPSPCTIPPPARRVGYVARLSAAESAAAVEAAHAAFPAWSGLLPQARSTLLRATWFQLILAHKDDLARIMTFEQGKPISEARGEIDYAASFVEFYAEEAKRLEHRERHLAPARRRGRAVRREPVGVAALITPWNFPSAC